MLSISIVSHVNRLALLLEEGEDQFEEAHVGAARRNVSDGDAGF